MTGKISCSALTRPVECDPYDATLRPLREASFATTQQPQWTSADSRPAGAPSRGLHIKAPLPAPDLAAGGSEEDRGKLVDEVTAKVIRWLQRRLPESGAEPSLGNELVFVVCPFDPDMDPVFDAVACAATAVGLRAARADDYRITDKILALLGSARLVVADLSRQTPNVYFELGYARALGKTVITIARTGTISHFDLHDWTHLEYVDSRPLEQQLRQRFQSEVDTSGAQPGELAPDRCQE